ncbi:MAG: hypothetical protein H7A51_10870 [Akkermansiaceae bacterium]|nr:hypothetical protein [Akkermansiaceae bacterium]
MIPLSGRVSRLVFAVAVLACSPNVFSQNSKGRVEFNVPSDTVLVKKSDKPSLYVFNNLLKESLEFRKFLAVNKEKVVQGSRVDPEIRLSTLLLMRQDYTTGGLPAIGGSVRQQFELYADYVSFTGQAHHANFLSKGFFVVYEREKLVHANSSIKRNRDKISIVGFSEKLSDLVYSNEEFIERASKKLETYLSTLPKE